MIQSAICDTQTESRKGRKPISGRAMTPAERKQRQRKRQRDAKRDERKATPTWLRLRRDIWRLMQDRFMFANAAELSSSLRAVADAITATRFAIVDQWGEPGRYTKTLMGNREPDEQIREAFRDLLPYEKDTYLENKIPGISEPILFELLRDMLNQSRIEDDDEQQTEDADE